MTQKMLLASKHVELAQLIENNIIGRLKTSEKNGVITLGEFDDYAENFGLQWNVFQKTQFDSETKLPLTETRLKECTEWDLLDLNGKLVLEIGSGAGRFTEIFLKYNAKVITVDLSKAIYANAKNNDGENIIFLRGDFKDLELFEGCFDFVFCYGVAQHTPFPFDVYKMCALLAKKGGKISIDHYKKLWHPSPFYFPKYVWRPLTTRLSPRTLLKIIQIYIPVYIKFDTFLIRYIPSKILSSLVRGCIPVPCWNYFGIENIDQNTDNLTNWAIMDTFDALGAKYDTPASFRTVKKWGKMLQLDNVRVKGGGNGVVFNAIK